MKMWSSAIPDGSVMGIDHLDRTCQGRNIRPDLTWTDVPAEAQSMAFTCFDPDAGQGRGWWHWIALDVPMAVTSLERGERLPSGAREWVTDWGERGYRGPCPPRGQRHRYVFTGFALDVAQLDVPASATPAEVGQLIADHALAHASFTGVYRR